MSSRLDVGDGWLLRLLRFGGILLTLSLAYSVGRVSLVGIYEYRDLWAWMLASMFGMWFPALLLTVAWGSYEQAGGVSNA